MPRWGQGSTLTPQQSPSTTTTSLKQNCKAAHPQFQGARFGRLCKLKGLEKPPSQCGYRPPSGKFSDPHKVPLDANNHFRTIRPYLGGFVNHFTLKSYEDKYGKISPQHPFGANLWVGLYRAFCSRTPELGSAVQNEQPTQPACGNGKWTYDLCGVVAMVVGWFGAPDSNFSKEAAQQPIDLGDVSWYPAFFVKQGGQWFTLCLAILEGETKKWRVCQSRIRPISIFCYHTQEWQQMNIDEGVSQAAGHAPTDSASTTAPSDDGDHDNQTDFSDESSYVNLSTPSGHTMPSCHSSTSGGSDAW